MFGRSKKHSEADSGKEKKVGFVRRILRRSKNNPTEEKDDVIDLEAPTSEISVNPRTLSKKLKQIVEEFKEEEGINIGEPNSPKDSPSVEVAEDDPRIESLQRKGSFQVVEGGMRLSRDQQIEVPPVWVTTPEVVG
eukprot:c3874_g1_i1.p1 GENE.c3874_g1_i1~~c3874_g1_i1.p1  ORF type:complete len:136 (+),score=26.78 c3874_g1_i1:29-436(+)